MSNSTISARNNQCDCGPDVNTELSAKAPKILEFSCGNSLKLGNAIRSRKSANCLVCLGSSLLHSQSSKSLPRSPCGTSSKFVFHLVEIPHRSYFDGCFARSSNLIACLQSLPMVVFQTTPLSQQRFVLLQSRYWRYKVERHCKEPGQNQRPLALLQYRVEPADRSS